MKVLIPLLLLLVAGCSARVSSTYSSGDNPAPKDPSEPQEVEYKEIIVHRTRYDIFNLPDDTQCIASYVKEVINCNWQPLKASP